MKIKQLTVFAENKTGYLAEITGLFAESGLDMKALSIADTKDFGILRIIVDDPEKALKVLNEHGHLGTITEVISVKIPDNAGELAKALKVLADADVNVESLYAFLAGEAGSAYVVIKATDNAAAEKALLSAGYNGIKE